MVSWFAIAVIFFAVTAVLAVGPLIVWRLFLGTDGDKPGDCRTFSVLPILLGVGTGLFVIAATVIPSGVFVSTRSNEPATVHAVKTVSTESASAAKAQESAERSLFESGVAHNSPSQSPPPPIARTVRPAVWALLLPVLVVAGMLAFASSRRHLFRVFPVALVALLVGYLYLGTWSNREALREARLQEATVAKATDEFALEQAQLRERERRIREQATRQIPVVTDESPGSAPVTVTVDESESMETPPPVTEYVGKELFGVSREMLPEWTSTIDDEGSIRVIHSGRHATVEAAERDALAQLKALLQTQFVKRHPQAAGWVPPDEVVVNSGSLLRRAVERSQIQVGEFVSPMYETHWQVDTSIEEPLYQAWRPNVVKTRLGWLGAGVGLLTLLFGSLAAVLRVDQQTGGKRRKALAAGTLAMWAAIGSALMFVA